MVLLTEQTRDWEKGRQSVVLRGVRRYSLVALGVALVAVPPLLIWIPDIIRLVNGPEYVGAASAARLLILAAAVQLVVGWTKSFPVTIGRPGLRILTHGIETIVVLPLDARVRRAVGRCRRGRRRARRDVRVRDRLGGRLPAHRSGRHRRRRRRSVDIGPALP